MSDTVVFLTPAEAKAMLPPKDMIHTFRSPVAGILVGADWPLADIVEAIDKCECELSGPAATASSHGLALHDAHGLLFVETNTQTK